MIVLYNPVSSRDRKPILPMSLLSLASLLEHRHRYAIVDGNLEGKPAERIATLIGGADPSILAVTVMPGPQLLDAADICRRLKSDYPKVTVIWGGYFPTEHTQTCLRSGFVDYVVRGHGELVFLRLADSLLRGDVPEGVDGLASQAEVETGALKPNRLPSIPDPDTVPDFPYHRLDMSRYPRSTFLGSRTLSHHSSYGCPFLCNFCAVVNMAEGRWVAQPAERVASVAKRLVTEFKADALEFYDNNFFVKESRVAEFAERILNLGIAWWGQARVDTLLKFSSKTWELMSGSGLKMVFMGAESGVETTLRRMNKGGAANPGQTLEIARKMRTYGIIPEFSFIVGNPPDPEGDLNATIEFILRLKKVNPASEVVLYPYTPVPLSGALFNYATAAGFTFPQTLGEWLSDRWQKFSRRESSDFPWADPIISQRVKDFRSVLNAYFPTETDPRLGGVRKNLLRGVAAWRYRSGFYRFPYELQLLDKLIHYQRPETSSF